MKRLFTLLSCALFVVAAYSQAPKTVLYLTDVVPFATEEGKHDQEMFDIITNLGYLVTAEAMSDASATTGYDVIFASEAPGSGNAYWHRYKEAPLPMVMGKVWAIKGVATALSWVAGENSGTDYGNSVDSIFVKAADHPISSCNLEDRFGIVNGGSTEGAIGAFVNFSVENPSGATTVYTSEVSDAEHTVVAIEPFTTLNGNTLANRVAIYGVHQVVYDEVNSNAIQLLDNCLKWAINGDVDCGTDAIDDKVSISANVYPNPSADGIVNVRLDDYASATVSVLSLDGRTIMTTSIYNENSVTLDLSDLNSGMYVVAIQGADINYTQSISLQ